MKNKFLLFYFYMNSLSFLMFAQTNKSGDITSNTTWTKTNSPYTLTGNVSIKNGAKLTIESGVSIFCQNRSIDVGDYYQSYSGLIDANNVTFNSGTIYFNSASSGTISNCSFTNTPTILRHKSNPILTNNNYDGSSILTFYSEEALPRISSNTYGSQKINLGMEITKNLTLKKIQNVDYYLVENIPIKNGAKLTIESGVSIFCQNRSIDVGDYYQSYSGLIDAINVFFNSGKIYINSLSSGSFSSCTFQNTPFYIRHNSSLVITKSNFDLFSLVSNSSSKNVDAKNNYWGDLTGPKHSTNPSGYGTTISDKVDYIPFATAPFSTVTTIFSIGNRIITVTSGANIRNDQLSDVLLFVQDEGVHGTIIDGPITGTAGGFTGYWWKIDWDSSPPSVDQQKGWVAESRIAMAPTVGDVPKPDFSKKFYSSSDNIFWSSGNSPTSPQKDKDFSPNALGNCTWYAFGRLLELGYSISSISAFSGNASTWDETALTSQSIAKGITVDTSPSKGAIAQSSSMSNGLGHVAIVESVNSNGTITITESSYSTNLNSIWNFLWRHRTIPSTQFEKYIHIPLTALTQYSITLSSNPFNGGSTSGGGQYNLGSSVTVSANANSGYIFSNWNEDGITISTNSNLTFVVDKNRSLVANFEKLELGSIIINGGFEQGLTNWLYVEFTQGSSVSVKTESNNKYISLKHLSNYDWCSIGQEVRSKLVLGQKYFISFRYKVFSGNNLVLGIRFADNSTVMHSTGIDKDSWSSTLLSDGQWHTKSIGFTASSDHPLSTEPMFSFMFDYQNTGEVYLDDLSFAIVTDVENLSDQLINDFVLGQNFPNPFNPTTTIKFSIPNSQLITLKVYDMLGREVTTLINEEKLPGNYEVKFNGSNLSSGTYFYRLRAGSYSDTKKFILMK